MSEAVVCESIRTPVGAFRGSLRDVPAQELAATVIGELVRRTGVTAEVIDDVVFGHCYPTMDAPAIGRVPRTSPTTSGGAPRPAASR